MIAKGHITLASIPALLVIDYYFTNSNVGFHIKDTTTLSYVLVFYFSTIFGSLIPDIDESESYLGRRLYAISIVISSIFKHRTFTHYLFLPVAIFAISFFVADLYVKIFVYGLSLGVLMHDIGDMLTKGGINGFFFPFFPNTKIAVLPRQLRFYTNSITEYIVIMFLILINSLILFMIAKQATLGALWDINSNV